MTLQIVYILFPFLMHFFLIKNARASLPSHYQNPIVHGFCGKLNTRSMKVAISARFTRRSGQYFRSMP